MTAEHPEQPGRVPVDELTELVEEWRHEYEMPAGTGGHLEVAKAFEKCGNELEELVEEYE